MSTNKLEEAYREVYTQNHVKLKKNSTNYLNDAFINSVAHNGGIIKMD